MPTNKMKFKHEVFDQQNKMINKAESTVAFVDINTRKPMRAPQIIVNKIKSYSDK